MPATISDDEFIRLWSECPSLTEIARRTGISERNVFALRRRVERRTGVTFSPAYHTSASAQQARAEVHASIAQHRIADGTIVVFSDAHYWPGEATTAHRALVKVLRKVKPLVVVANGDMFDAAQASRHPRIGWERTPTVREELDACTLRMREIEAASKGAVRYWCVGNHDLRFDTRLSALVPAFEGVPGFSLREHFPAWKFVVRLDVNDDIVIKHRFRSGVHAAHNGTLWSGKSMVCGHLHSLKVWPFTDYKGTRYSVDTGTLADPDGAQFNYKEGNPANHRAGFAVLTFAAGKLMPPELCEVIGEGRTFFRGEVIEV